MSTFNTPLWGSGDQPGTIDDQPPFPELYIRNFLNDEGILPSELTPLLRYTNFFRVQVDGETQFTISKVPGQEFTPIVYLNEAPQTPTVNYIINSRTITFPPDILVVDDVVKVVFDA